VEFTVASRVWLGQDPSFHASSKSKHKCGGIPPACFL
jgi:hypothetical protein